MPRQAMVSAVALLCLALAFAPAVLASKPFAPLMSMQPARYPTSTLADAGSQWCNGANRTDCGYVGINQPICEGRGCCWVPRNPNPGNEPWCFFKSPVSPSCSTSPPCSGHGSCGGNGTCTCTGGFATCGSVTTTTECSVNLQTDNANCGNCGHACPSGTGVASSTCSSGTCDTTCAAGYVLCFGECVQGTSCNSIAPFTPADMKTMVGYYLKNLNIQNSGAVAASPSHAQPNYFFHWTRDGAISMRELMSVRTISEAQTMMQNYVTWVRKVQFDSDPNGIDIRGEPKYFLGWGGPLGNVYDKGWLRPQNDGCALRTVTILMYAQKLLAAGNRAYVAKNIWTGSDSVPGVQRDLQYVMQVWNQNSGDPWEEVTGQVFFDKFAQRHALLLGAEMATTFGDTSAATTYKSVAAQIEANIISVHWNAQEGIIMEVPNTRPLDSATHLGVLYGHVGDGFLDPSTEKVQSSVSVLVEKFSTYTDFQINAKDTAAGIPGLLVGRYLYDHYNGGNTSQPQGGNPWILCTAGLADIYYQASKMHMQHGFIQLSSLNARFFEQAMLFAAPLRTHVRAEYDALDSQILAAIASKRRLSLYDDATRAMFARLTGALTLSGDAILLRLRHHVEGNNFHLPEEINKITGESQGAQDLTWSYGTVIGAMTSRAAAMDNAHQSLQQHELAQAFL